MQVVLQSVSHWMRLGKPAAQFGQGGVWPCRDLRLYRLIQFGQLRPDSHAAAGPIIQCPTTSASSHDLQEGAVW